MKTFTELMPLFPNNQTILDTVAKTLDHIEDGEKIMVSVSGGADSDILVDLFERIGYEPGQVVYVWFDTGLEYEATKYAKKNVAHEVEKVIGCEMTVTGVRRAEGGKRATMYKSCYSPATDSRIAQFRPVFYWTDADKREYEEYCGVVHSDCYTVYGFKRTGCACCPFGSGFEEELEVIKEYEPKLYKAACNIFGESYEYTRKYRKFKESWKREKRRGGQIDLFDNWEDLI